MHITTLLSFLTCCMGTSKTVPNVISNGDFEHELAEEWYLKKIPGVKIFIDSLESYSGSNSIKIENYTLDNIHHFGCNQTLSPPPVCTWMKLRVALKTSDLDGRAGVDVHFRDVENKRIPKFDASFTLRGKNLSRNWQVYTIDFSIPEGTKIILVALFIKGQGTVWFDNITLSIIESETNLYKQPSNGAYILKADNPTIWFEYVDQKVYKDTPPPSTRGKQEIEISGARNEWESFQFVVYPKTNMKDCYLQFKDLVSKNGHRINQERLSYYQVGYVNIKQTSSPYGVIGFNPDYLIKGSYFVLNAHINNPIWIDLYIPKHTKPGTYHGEILLRSEHRILATIPLRVEVWNFQLPDESHLDVKSHFDIGLIKRYDNRETADILADYYENLSAHRVNIMDVWQPRVIIDGNNVKCVFDNFDNTVVTLFENYDYDAITTGPFFGDATGWDYRLNWWGIDIESLRFKQLFKQYCQQFEEHLREKGWLNRCYIYYWDEPPMTDPHFDKIVTIGKIIKESAPRLKIFMTKWPIPELFGIVDIWCISFDNRYFYPRDVVKRSLLGEKIFVYHNDPYIDTPLIDKRLYTWRYLKAHVDGVFAWWNITKWLDNPYRNPHRALPRNDGSTFLLKPGNGVLLYPNQHGSGPPVNSIRWEIFRQGLEDYEYLWLLKHTIRQARTHLYPHEAFKDYEEHRQQLYVHSLVQDYFNHWADDVDRVHYVRKKLAEEIQSVVERPYLLIKLMSTEEEGCVRIVGLTEKNTRIWLDKDPVHVDTFGYFTGKTTLSENGCIKIKAVSDNKIKLYEQFVR